MTSDTLVAASNRALLAQLAREPDRHAPTAWTAPAAAAATRIRAHLLDHTRDGEVSFETLLAWRQGLDNALDQLASRDPALWTRWRQPGTWLDCHLRLRSLIAHVAAKAFWEELSSLSYDSFETERFLWGAR